jgi:hypothetical protein
LPDEHSHALARNRIADQETQAKDADDRSVRRVAEPLGADFDEPSPADLLRHAVADPGDQEDGNIAGGCEE